MPFKDYREESRTRWGTHDEKIDREQLKLGALLRIADSLEKMEKPFDRLIRDVQYHQERADGLSKSLTKAEHRIAGLRGYIKRTKGKK